MAEGLLEFEAGQVQYPWEELTDAGDGMTFEASNAPWSVQGDVPTQVKPYGIETGGRATPGEAADHVHIAAMTVAMPGSPAANENGVVTVAADDVEIQRGTESDPFRVTAITVNEDGNLVAVAGDAHTAFDDDHGKNGGPPLIPTTSVLVCIVRTNSHESAVLTSSEIMSISGVHREESMFPIFGRPDYARGAVSFRSELPKIHTGDKPKKVFAIYATPVFQDLPDTTDYVPAETSHSVSSTETHQGARGSRSSSLNAATFSVILDDGITEPLMRQRDREIWFRWRPNPSRDLPYQLTLGTLGIARTNPASGDRTASCTIAAESASVDVTE